MAESEKPAEVELSKTLADTLPTVLDTPNVGATAPVSNAPPSRRIQKWQLVAAVTGVVVTVIGVALSVR